jgi:arylsulfatase A-like enzyme
VLILMADDQGWGDVGFRGHDRLRTPNLDAMAANGIVLDRFYAAAPVCSPTRASVLTGRHPMRLGIPGANAGHLPRDETTLAEMLGSLGYRTGFFGKWHLGTLTTNVRDSNRGGRPEQARHFTTPGEHGFDEWFATEAKVPTWNPMLKPGTREPYGTAYWNGGESPVGENLGGDDSRVIVDRVEHFVRSAVADERPFLGVVWFHAPHRPVVAGPAMLARYADVEDDETRAYYGCLTALDEQVGRVRALLRELDVADDTIVWYASDNGPEGRASKAPGTAGPLRGRKRDLYEGGVRVPGIVEWPARIDAGSKSAAPCVTSDILPTIAAVVGAAPPRDRALDGIDVGNVLRGDATERRAPIGFWSGRRLAWIGDRWKIISTDGGATWELYDLVRDPGERTDLASEHPDRVTRLASELEAWRGGVEQGHH